MAKKKTLKDEDVITTLRADIANAASHMQILSQQRVDAYDLYRFQPLGNERDGFSQVVDSVVWNTVEWLKPNLSGIFSGDFFNLKCEDFKKAENFKKYLRYLLFRKQKGERLNKDFLHDCLLNHFGIFKVFYKNDYKEEEQKFDRLSGEEFNQISSQSDIEITKYDEVEETFAKPSVDWQGLPIMEPVSNVYYENVKAVKSHPIFSGPCHEVTPPWELYYTPGYPDIDSCPFVGHRVKRTLDYVLKKERQGEWEKGSYEAAKSYIDNSKEHEDNVGELTSMYDVDNLALNDRAPDKTELTLNEDEVWIWECYRSFDIDGDGLLEPCITVICGDAIMQKPMENPYKKQPFILGYAYKEPHKMEATPLPLLLEHEQKEQTNIRRIIVDAAAESAYKTVVVNSQHVANQWGERVIGTAIVGNSDQVKEVQTSPPTQFILRAYELGDTRIENKTGVTKYNQGLDANSLNKTASGINMVMSASQMRTRYIASSIAEAFEELIRRYICILQVYPPEDAINVVGENLIINPEDMRGEWDIEIDIGVGPQEKALAVQHLDEHIAFLIQAGIPMGIATPIHLVKALVRKFKMANINAADLMMPESEIEQKLNDNGFIQQLDGLIKQLSGQGMPPEQIGVHILEKIGGYMNEREQAAGPGATSQPGGNSQPSQAGGSGSAPGMVR